MTDGKWTAGTAHPGSIIWACQSGGMDWAALVLVFFSFDHPLSLIRQGVPNRCIGLVTQIIFCHVTTPEINRNLYAGAGSHVSATCHPHLVSIPLLTLRSARSLTYIVQLSLLVDHAM